MTLRERLSEIPFEARFAIAGVIVEVILFGLSFIPPFAYAGDCPSVSKADGSLVKTIPLGMPPVFDGLSAANGQLFMAMEDGEIICWR